MCADASEMSLSCPIIFLTARVDEADKINGFAAGGDDYVVKPFSPAELEARVSAHISVGKAGREPVQK